MKSLSLCLSILLFTFHAKAQDVRSEFFYQAGANENFVEGQLAYTISNQDFVMGLSDEVKDIVLKAAFESGMNEMLSVYGNLGYGTAEMSDGGPKFSGITPINLGAKIRMQIGSGEVYAKANLGLSTFSKRDCDASGDCNRLDGSTNLALRLGYLWSFDSAFFGMAVDLGIFSTDGKDKDDSSIEYKYKNGISLTAFYEALVLDMIFGGSIGYAKGNEAGTTPNSFAPSFYGEGNSTDTLNLSAYARVPMSEGFQLLGGVYYSNIIDQENDLNDGGNTIGFNLGLRYSL